MNGHLKHLMTRVVWTLMIFIPLSYGAQAKFLLTPMTSTRMQLTTNQTATVQYRVTNQTKITRTLTMVPISQVTQTTTGSGVCSSPFTLAPHESCLLTLAIDTVSTTKDIKGGPQVCKTQSGNNNPDPFLCSQPATGAQLIIKRVNTQTLSRLTANPSRLSLTAGGSSGNIIVTNNSRVLTINNVHANLTGTILDTNVTQTESDCASVAPGGICTLTFDPGNNSVSLTSFPIQGDNGIATVAAIDVVNPAAPTLSATNSPLVIPVGSSATSLVIENTSSSINAYNIIATSTALSAAGVTIDNSGCVGPVAPGDTCNILFTPGSTAVPSTQVTITGDNNVGGTAITSASVSITTAVNLSLTPSSLTLIANGTTTGTMVITNNGTGDALNVQADFTQTALNGYVTATTCDTIPANGGVCSMVFTPGFTSVVATTFPISSSGNNSQTITGALTIESLNAAYFTLPINNNVELCYRSESSITSCSSSGIDSDFINTPQGITANSSGTFAYMANYNAQSSSSEYFVTQCTIDPITKQMNGYCVDLIDSTFNSPANVTINTAGTYAYVTNPPSNQFGQHGTTVSVCPICQSGTSIGEFGSGAAVGCANTDTSCTTYNGSSTGTGTALFSGPVAVALNENFSVAYVTNSSSSLIYQCSVSPSNGGLTNCGSPISVFSPSAITLDPSGAYVYTVSGIDAILYQCPVDQSTGLLTVCTAKNIGVNARFAGVAVNKTNTLIYLTSQGNGTGFDPYHLFECPITTVNGVSTVGSCVAQSGLSNYTLFGVWLLV